MRTYGDMEIAGYRRLFAVEAELRPLTVMIGANGVGKTSLLEVFSILAASTLFIASITFTRTDNVEIRKQAKIYSIGIIPKTLANFSLSKCKSSAFAIFSVFL